MRFLTFNLWHGLSPSTPVIYEALEPNERRRLREARQIEVLRDVAPDVCFFQEVNPAVTRAPALARALKMKQTFQLDLVGLKLFGLGLPLNLNSGLVIAAAEQLNLSRVDAVSLSRPNVNLVKTWGSWQLREERFALFGEARLPNGDKILLINTHVHHGLESTPEMLERLDRLAEDLQLSDSMTSELRERLARGNARRRTEIGHLLGRLDVHRGAYRAVVLAGDFNVAPGSELGRMLIEYGFRDAWADVNPDDPGFTFDRERNPANHLLQARFPLTLVVEDLSFSPKVKDALLELARAQETKPRRIDYVWVKSQRGAHRVTKCQLVGLPDQTGLAPSDHFGVAADVEFE